MEKEYQELDRRLFDKRRRDGTACVLLHGQPGSGKSHLARQYVNKNRKKFGGGVFWITAKSKEERYHAFWNLKQKVVCRDKPELCDGINGKDFVPLVKAWFEGRQEWLVVFDGVTVERDEDTTDFANFVPDSRNSSIIYISRARSLESKQRLLRPFPIKVGPLKEDDAKKLLFKELHIKRPTEAEKRKANELVRNIGGLPLAINAISQRLADTHEPLTKYKLSYSADPTIEETYNKILDDLQRLGHMEAWNLIHILCWFGHEIPVEMVHLGLRILRTNVEVRATEIGGRPDINTTFGELRRYALIERNEPDDVDSMSSSRNSLVDPEPIDMLKIHSVVQNFCCDSLNTRGLLPQWLGYAVGLFSFSYHQADLKIKHRPDTARVSDYRYYKVHGQRLWDHSVHYESKTQDLGSIRQILQPTLSIINEEILQHEPSSSQESLKNGIFQISIFDRTSSSSDSGPGPLTPDHRPTPPPLDNETLFGFPKGKTADSPGSFDAASVGTRPKIVGYSPRLPDLDDIGYESEQEGQRTSRPMQQDLSGHTARPSPPSLAPATAKTYDEDWQVVPSAWKPRKPRGRRDLGSFRPTTARPQIDRRSVAGSVVQSDPDDRQVRETSPAFKSLKKVQSRSPPPSRNGIASLFQRGPLGRTTAPPVTQTTWAGIAAGRAGQQPQQRSNGPSSATAGRPAAPMIMERGRSRESLRSRRDNARSSPSPLGSEFVPRRGSAADTGEENVRTGPAYPAYTNERPPAGFQYTTPYPGSSSSLAQIAQGRPIDGNLPYYNPPPLGPNLAPLPVEESITITTKRPLPPYLYEQPPSPFFPPPESHYSSQPQSRTSPHQPYQQVYNAPYPPPIMPAIPKGYYSQPMSRHHSDQSRDSTAETDPVRYPSNISPRILPSDALRERHSDGRPFRKSPKTDFARPIYSAHSSPRIQPHDLSHTGGWAYPSPSHSAPDPYDMSMSRSSSGPGVAVSDAPGRIIRFDNAGSVQFGEHQPISLEEARRRTKQHAVRLQDRHREMEALKEVDEESWRRRRVEERKRQKGRVMQEGEGRRESAPYPENNLIPTEEGIVREGRPRGLSAPNMDEAVGLGVNLG
ncbi:hypothetical protein HO173_006169 [Letharia columbiana]|uniref:NB-ARC domain-containing protein n=1 Tax=Letharia columbiana TaxID=112416 RepID=A0A8H6FVI3_9LECA|nr:uncharacterized protein HO173_006169 [Letharia columbiana]KAF6235486.1 hypothetical protein HO173_006169 [Letharia columbiana]